MLPFMERSLSVPPVNLTPYRTCTEILRKTEQQGIRAIILAAGIFHPEEITPERWINGTCFPAAGMQTLHIKAAPCCLFYGMLAYPET
jgi:hypothetical protein